MLYSGSFARFATMSHMAISSALHADMRSSEARRIAKSSNMICAVWRMFSALRPMTCFAIACRHCWITGSLPGVT